MLMTRRQLLKAGIGTAAGLALAAESRRAGAQAAHPTPGVRVGMCDWNLGKTGQVDAISLAQEVGLDGVEVSIDFPGPGQHLRDEKMQRQYLVAAKSHGVAIPSVALGILNGVPLKSEPKAAIWLLDAIGVARRLGAANMLLAFFGSGELRMQDERDIARVVDVLREAAPRAEKARVTLGLENTLSAQDNMAILDRVRSDAVRVYYDLKNSADLGRDVPAEIRMLGNRICQVHVKNGDLLLSQRTNVDFPACAQALRDIGYTGWYILETASPSDFRADTRANIEYVRKTFA